MSQKRNRQVWSLKNELVEKSREAALSAVQIYNNPTTKFKSESFIVLMIIAWTYLMHAHYRSKNIEYRHYTQKGKRRQFTRVRKNGPIKYWELEACLKHEKCPLNDKIKTNLRFLLELRHEIEHRMTHGIDEYLSAKLQACCLNYNTSLKALFDIETSDFQPVSLQFFAFTEEQVTSLKNAADVPKNIIDFVNGFEAKLSDEEKRSPHYRYNIIYLRENVNHEGQADKAIRFINDDSAEGKDIHSVLLKNRKRPNLTFDDLAKKLSLNKVELGNLIQILDAKNNITFSEKTTVGKRTETWKYTDQCLQAMRKWLASNDKTTLKTRKRK